MILKHMIEKIFNKLWKRCVIYLSIIFIVFITFLCFSFDNRSSCHGLPCNSTMFILGVGWIASILLIFDLSIFILVRVAEWFYKKYNRLGIFLFILLLLLIFCSTKIALPFIGNL